VETLAVALVPKNVGNYQTIALGFIAHLDIVMSQM